MTGGRLITSGHTIKSIQRDVTAGTTQTQGQAPIVADFVEVTTVANDRDVVTLPPCVSGASILIKNKSTTNNLQVFPASGDNFYGSSTNNSIIVKPTDSLYVWGVDNDEWQYQNGFEGRTKKTTRVTNTYTILESDHDIFCNTDSAGYTVTLPAGAEGQEFYIKNTGSSGNTLTIAPDGSEHLIGANSNQTLADGEVLRVVYNATDGWY